MSSDHSGSDGVEAENTNTKRNAVYKETTNSKRNNNGKLNSSSSTNIPLSKSGQASDRPRTSISSNSSNTRSGSSTQRSQSGHSKRQYFTNFEEAEKRYGRYPVKFRFKPLFTPRITAYSHCWNEKKWDDKYYGEHRVKVAEARSMVDTKPPQTYMHLHLKLKKLQLEEERLATIERDNRILLEKMAYIMRTQGRINNKNDYEYKSLNREKRMNELIRVTQENQSILRRILNRTAEYDHKKWQTDWEKNERYMDSIAHFQKDWWKAAGGQSAKGGRAQSSQRSQRSQQSQRSSRSPSRASKTSKKSSKSQRQQEEQEQEQQEAE